MWHICSPTSNSWSSSPGKLPRAALRNRVWSDVNGMGHASAGVAVVTSSTPVARPALMNAYSETSISSSLPGSEVAACLPEHMSSLWGGYRCGSHLLVAHKPATKQFETTLRTRRSFAYGRGVSEAGRAEVK